MRGLSRRGFLGALGISALGVTSLGALALPGSAGQTGELVRSRVPLPPPFGVPLPVPPVAKPVRTDATTDYYEITLLPLKEGVLQSVSHRPRLATRD